MRSTTPDGRLIRTLLIDGHPTAHEDQGHLYGTHIDRRMAANGATRIPGGWETAGSNGHAYRWTVDVWPFRDDAVWLPADAQISVPA